LIVVLLSDTFWGESTFPPLTFWIVPWLAIAPFGAGGYGLAMGCGQGWVGHAGELSGYNSTMFYDTATDTTVSVQTNSDIASGGCENSPTLQDDPGDEICAVSAVRIFVALSGVLGQTYQPPPRS
jgi:D-alanyl-D-alanine carboxypeptidase